MPPKTQKRNRENEMDSDEQTDHESNVSSSSKPKNKNKKNIKSDYDDNDNELKLKLNFEKKSKSFNEKILKEFEKHNKEYLKNKKTNNNNKNKKIKKILNFIYNGIFNNWLIKILISIIPFLLCILNIIFGELLGFSGPFLNFWVIKFKGIKYGAWGECKDSKSLCEIQLFYQGPEIGQWSKRALPAILLSFALVSTLQFFSLLYTFLFIRHKFISECFSDLELGSGKKRNILNNKKRSIKWFERIMDLTSIIYLMLSLILAGWVSESNSNGLSGYDLSKWVSNTNTRKTTKNGLKSDTHSEYERDSGSDEEYDYDREEEEEYDEDGYPIGPARRLRRAREDED
uniref:Uncharacterized protein n=1 Tax=Kwoniella pini CBS 10737 TaxID=1296096 RepID=A0A1B9I0S3_9TREE|nr:uncharacterized protein I206_04831 [Kwoniella pini CBS 10737]OCF49143.1 hypothetical protein I206_04831 [Kwoniella pini CBS 10737]